MRSARFLPAALLVCCALLAACSIPGMGAPTPPPIIIVATAAPANNSTAAPQASAAPTAAQAPTPTPLGPAPTVSADAPSKGTITFAFDSFPTYFPGLLAEARGLLKQRGYTLQLVPFGLDGQNSVPEQQRYEKLRSGEWDVMATTMDGFARVATPDIGAVTTVIDESAGADKLVAHPDIKTVNDLRGKRVAFSKGSVGEYFLYYALKLAGMVPADITPVPQESVADAVKAYTDGQADAVSAWEPDVLTAQQQGAQELIASDKLRAILDVLVTARPALDTKAEGVQAFHDAWYEALKLMIDSPDAAGQAIVDWGHSDWTYIAKPEDLRAALAKLAQATLGANQIAFQSPDLLASRLRESQSVWAAAGQAPPASDLRQLVDGRFVQGSVRSAQLFSSQQPVNPSFLLTARVELPQLSPEEQQSAQAVVKLPLEQIGFEPESTRLTAQAMSDLSAQVLPVLRSSRLYLKIEGSAAWPGPEGRFSQEDIRAFARDRANSVATFLAQQGIDTNRLILGTLDPKFPNSLNESELVQDRIVRFTLVTTGGR
jgi:NitT/TauT family transport system substrate-binding protein